MERRSPKMTVHSRLPHDVEKGLPLSSSPLGLFQRRRRLTVVLLLMAAMTLFIVTVSHQTGQSLTTWNWVKDSMRPSSEWPFGLSETAKAGADDEVKVPALPPADPSPASRPEAQEYKPTKALIGLANELGISVEGAGDATEAQQQGQGQGQLKASDSASREDRVLLLLRMIKNPDYHVQYDDWRGTLLPQTAGDVAATLKRFFGSAESAMYLDDHVAWLTKQHQQSPLTVFSKSYCPYSRRAKELLREQHAKFDVYEVDLRADAEHLQMALREISGHRTVSLCLLTPSALPSSDRDILYSSLPYSSKTS